MVLAKLYTGSLGGEECGVKRETTVGAPQFLDPIESDGGLRKLLPFESGKVAIAAFLL